MFIGGITFERQTLAQDKYKRIGQIWYDETEHYCSLLMHGFRMGHCFAKPYGNVEAPYLKGDINITTGEYLSEGVMKKDYLWCGFIWTESNQEGCIYQIVFEVDPTPIYISQLVNKGIRMREKEKDYKLDKGIYLSVHLEDKEQVHGGKPVEKVEEKIKTEDSEIDNLPF